MNMVHHMAVIFGQITMFRRQKINCKQNALIPCHESDSNAKIFSELFQYLHQFLVKIRKVESILGSRMSMLWSHWGH